MKNFAIITDGVVSDILVADQIFVLEAMFPDNLVVEATEDTGYPYIGGTFSNGKFVTPKPFDSWLLSPSGNSWAPPVEHPQDGKPYSWDEESLSWIEIVTEPVAEDTNA
jgi:hypothetical protein